MDNPPTHSEQVVEHWDAVIEDMEATAAEYHEDGWDVVEIHPGHVNPVDTDDPDGLWGLDVLVPDNEFPEVERRVLEEDGSFDACEVFRASSGGLVFLVVAMREEDREEAILFPAYYAPPEAKDMLRRARQEGKMQTHLRTLEPDNVVTFTQDDPSLFLPE